MDALQHLLEARVLVVDIKAKMRDVLSSQHGKKTAWFSIKVIFVRGHVDSIRYCVALT